MKKIIFKVTGQINTGDYKDLKFSYFYGPFDINEYSDAIKRIEKEIGVELQFDAELAERSNGLGIVWTGNKENVNYICQCFDLYSI